MSHVLIVEDDPDAASLMSELVARERFSVATAHSLLDARRQLNLQTPDVVLLDLQLPDGSGLALFDERDLLKHSEVILITGHASLETSIQALRVGAADYLIKPVRLEQLRAVLSRAMRPSALRDELEDLTDQWQRDGHFGHLWGRSPAMQRVYEQISRVAGTGVTVFISGESGTGKEVVARAVHDLSRRRNRPFLAVNCGAISPQLIESEMFGHEKGSFTGADRQHQGFFERANGGTLFLDEITEMPLELQVKLLRVLETGSFMRVGSTQLQSADVRIIAATNRAPERAVEDGKLREDLHYRLNVFPLLLPPLREREGDVALLADHFLESVCESEGAVKRFSAAAYRRLAQHRWPGNVRELRNVVYRAYVMSPAAEIGDDWLLPEGVARHDAAPPAALAPPAPPLPASPAATGVGAEAPPSVVLPIGTSMADAERRLILATLEYCGNSKERAAAVLGLSLKTVYNRVKEYTRDAGKDELRSTARS